MNRLATLILLACLGCGSGTASLPPDAYQADADAVALLAFYGAKDAADTPDSKPDRNVGDECDNCHGTGRSGDGLGRCNVCGGDGRIDERDLATDSPPDAGVGDGGKRNSVLPDVVLPTKTIEIETPEIPVTMVLHYSPADYHEWAKLWWEKEKPRYEKQGITVTPERESQPESWLEVCARTCERVSGVPTREKVREAIERVKK